MTDPAPSELAAWKALHSNVIGDVLDALGRTHQFLEAHVRPLADEMTVVGYAMPVLITEVRGPQSRPFGRLTEALDDLQHDEVYLARAAGLPCASWGEILTATARRRAAAGAVIDGFHRDTARVLEQNWPVFSRGAYGQDAAVRAAVIDYRVRVGIGQVDVTPGDIVFGDRDGVVIVPQDLSLEVLERSLEKVNAENTVLLAIEGGMSSTEAFATYGVL